MTILLFLYFFFFGLGSSAQIIPEKECRATVNLDVLIDTIYAKVNTVLKSDSTSPGMIVDFGAFCNPCFKLRAANVKYEIVSFIVEAETEEVIIERSIEGNGLSDSRLLDVIYKAKRDLPINFYCIKARHQNGNIYVLKPFSVIKR